MQSLGVSLDSMRNATAHHLPTDVADADSLVRIWAVATNEEISMARSTYQATCES